MSHAARPLPTVKVFDPDGDGPMLINKADYEADKERFKLYKEAGIADLKVGELRKLAQERGIDGFDKMKKADLVEALSE